MLDSTTTTDGSEVNNLYISWTRAQHRGQKGCAPPLNPLLIHRNFLFLKGISLISRFKCLILGSFIVYVLSLTKY